MRDSHHPNLPRRAQLLPSILISVWGAKTPLSWQGGKTTLVCVSGWKYVDPTLDETFSFCRNVKIIDIRVT